MQRPTCTNVRIRSVEDAQIIFYGVAQGILPMVTRRLDSEERRTIRSGSVYVWEERGTNPDTSIGIERWTDGKRWGPSRVRDVFLFYHEKEPDNVDIGLPLGQITPTTMNFAHYNRLVKQTYSVYLGAERSRRKWHLIAYFTQETIDNLRTVEDVPSLARLCVPEGTFYPARIIRNAANIRVPTSSGHQVSTPSPPRRSNTPPRGAPYMLPPPRLPPPAPVQPPLWPAVKYDPALANTSSGTKFRVTAGGAVEIPPLAFIENTNVPKRTAVDEYALRSFSIEVGLGFLPRPSFASTSTRI